MEKPPTDARLDIEFAYTDWADSCRDLYSIVRCCRRPKGHSDTHASGHAQHRLRWPR